MVNLISNRIMLGKEIAISKYDNTFNNIDDNTIYKLQIILLKKL